MGKTNVDSVFLPETAADAPGSAYSDRLRTAFILAESDFTPELDNDCACPDTPFLLQTESPRGSYYAWTKDVFTRDLPRGFTLAFSPLAAGGPCVLSPYAWSRLQEFHAPLPLANPIDQQLADQRLIWPVGAPAIPRTDHAPTTLTVWLHVTNACNLNCPYCYVRKSSARMSTDIGRRSLDHVFDVAARHGFQTAKLKYAGGEATLNLPLVRQLHAYGQQLAAAAGIRLREVLLSNGVRISADDANWLTESTIKLMISLDGVGDHHDAQRPTVRGRGSFAALQRTVDDLLLPRGLRPEICVTITRRNALHAFEAVAWALERDLPFSLNFYRDTAHAVARSDLVLEEDLIIDGMRRAYAVIEQHMPDRPFLGGMLDRTQAQAHTHTCGVGLSYLVFTHEGHVAQCQMHQGEARPIGSGWDPLQLVAQGPIRNLSVDDKEGCRSCSYRYRCTGGCPVETFRATGRWDVQSPHCRIYRALFPDMLRLEGLRLLKINGWPMCL